jgi:hypothetical protein
MAEKKPSTALSQQGRGGREMEHPARMIGQPFEDVGVIVLRTSQALLSCSKIRATRESILKAGWNHVTSDSPARRVDLVNRQAHPQFRNLMLHDEQHLVMRAGERLLRAENLVDMKIVAIGPYGLQRKFRRVLPTAPPGPPWPTRIFPLLV